MWRARTRWDNSVCPCSVPESTACAVNLRASIRREPAYFNTHQCAVRASIRREPAYVNTHQDEICTKMKRKIFGFSAYFNTQVTCVFQYAPTSKKMKERREKGKIGCPFVSSDRLLEKGSFSGQDHLCVFEYAS